MPRNKKSQILTDSYKHDQETPMRPEVGLQAQFKKKKEPVKYRFDKSLDPELSWDINADREYAESLIARIIETDDLEEAREAAQELKRMSKPFLNWAGKAERFEMSVPTLPLFIHERLSTQAILETLKGHKLNGQMNLLFAEPQLDISDRITKAYEHKDKWVNRMILGDSLVAMNSLIQYESLAGKVQMIYMDPPYGVKFGSNFQPFIRKRDVKNNDDADFTREPEMVQAYRDTWELGLHSYLTYLRDRLLLARDLLTLGGSVFVQISNENVHHVREVLDEVFGSDNFVTQITYKVTSGFERKLGPRRVQDFILWYAKNIERCKFNRVHKIKGIDDIDFGLYKFIEIDGQVRNLSHEERENPSTIPTNGKVFRTLPLQTMGTQKQEPREFEGEVFVPPPNTQWRHTLEMFNGLVSSNRIMKEGSRIVSKFYVHDFPFEEINTIWFDTGAELNKDYVVQTSIAPIRRCILMTTDPGDLVLDPTCGSGTTAYVAEQWGRRWITMDVSRVPLALARQRLLTATYDYYELRDESAGVAGGFKYERKQNRKGEEVGGIVPHITLKSIANNEPPKEEVLVDRPNKVSGIVRISGPFTVEATIPTPIEMFSEDNKVSSSEIADYKTRMLETLRKVATFRVGNQTVKFKIIKAPAKSMNLDAEAEQIVTGLDDLAEEASIQSALKLKPGKPVAFAFGPENGAVSEGQVFNAAKEAYGKNFSHLYIIGFACQDAASKLISKGDELLRIPISYVSATMDLQMVDLLKDQRSSHVFAVTGLPDITLKKLKEKGDSGEVLYQVELLGLDTFDPTTMETLHLKGDDVPAWLLDCDYNELAFCANQVFFPRTKAWDKLKKALKGTYSDEVFEHLGGAVSAPFSTGENNRIAVKVLDDRGNELMVVKDLDEAETEI